MATPSSLSKPKIVKKKLALGAKSFDSIHLSLVKKEPYDKFTDSSKTHTLFSTMVDFVNSKELSDRTTIKCYWDRNTFDCKPVGIPVKYEKKGSECIFYVDGIFCSFNCCYAYLKEHSSDEIYNESLSLMYLLYRYMHGENAVDRFNPAPSWRLLEEYGGPMTIEEFRMSFSNYVFFDMKQINFNRGERCEKKECKQIPITYIHEQVETHGMKVTGDEHGSALKSSRITV